MNWFKLYAEFALDPKVQSMSEAMQRRLLMIFCLHCGGNLDGLTDAELALALRIRPTELEKTRVLFRSKGFIDETWVPKNWQKRQAPIDPTARERMRKLRERDAQRYRNVTGNVMNNPSLDCRILETETKTETETEGRGKPPPPPSSSLGLGPEFGQVGEFAIRVAGDVSWGSWVDRQGMCGHSAGDIRRAIEEASGAGKLSQPYVAAKLRNWAAEGGPPRRKGEDNGKTAVQQRPEETQSRFVPPDLDALPDTPAVQKLRATYGRPEEDTS